MNHPKVFTTIRNKINSMSGITLAWLSFVAAIVGGAAASACWIGNGVIKGVAGGLPFHIGLTSAVILTIMGIADLWRDLIPNRFAVYAAALLPSLYLVVNGKVGHAVHGWTDHINTWSHQHMGDLLGEGSALAITVLCLASAFILSNKAASRTPSQGQGRDAMAGADGRR